MTKTKAEAMKKFIDDFDFESSIRFDYRELNCFDVYLGKPPGYPSSVIYDHA